MKERILDTNPCAKCELQLKKPNCSLHRLFSSPFQLPWLSSRAYTELPHIAAPVASVSFPSLGVSVYPWCQRPSASAGTAAPAPDRHQRWDTPAHHQQTSTAGNMLLSQEIIEVSKHKAQLSGKGGKLYQLYDPYGPALHPYQMNPTPKTYLNSKDQAESNTCCSCTSCSSNPGNRESSLKSD